MTDTRSDHLRMALRSLIDEHRTDAASLSREIGRSKDYIRDFLEGRKTTLPLQSLVKIEEALSLTPGFLLKEEFINTPVEALTQIAYRISFPPHKTITWDETSHNEKLREVIPVFSYRDAMDGTLFVNQRVHYEIPRPHIVQSSPDAYGLIVEGENMSPVYDPGDTVLLNPAISFRLNADALLFEQPTTSPLTVEGTNRSALRRLVGYDQENWLVQEFSPARQTTLPRKDWPQLHRVVGKFSRP